MSGRTGKMTSEAIRERGPRMVLACLTRFDGPNEGLRQFVIYREGAECFAKVGRAPFMTSDSAGYIDISVVAKSYSLSYLMAIGRTMGGAA